MNDIKAVRRELKKLLAKEGVKVRTIGGKGTGWGWTDIAHPKGKNEWSEKEKDVLQGIGIAVGHKSNWGILSYEKLPSAVGGLKHKKYKKSKKYKDFVADFCVAGRNAEDWGTCCLGAGTVVKKNGEPIDFIRQFGQSDHKNIVAEKIMKQKAEKMGLSFRHESGRMD